MERGQVGIEFILMVGLVLLIVITAIPYILQQNELNNGIAAARNGATFAMGMRGLGYAGSGVQENPLGVLKLDRIEYSVAENATGKDDVYIEIYLKGSSYLNTASITGTVSTQARRYIAYAFSGQWPGTTVSLAQTTGSYYIFHVNEPTWVP